MGHAVFPRCFSTTVFDANRLGGRYFDSGCGWTKDGALQISLAQWTINRELRSGKIDNLDFAKVAAEHGIHAVEYVNQFFMDKAKDANYLGEMKSARPIRA